MKDQRSTNQKKLNGPILFGQTLLILSLFCQLHLGESALWAQTKNSNYSQLRLEESLKKNPDNINLRIELATSLALQKGNETKIIDLLNAYLEQLPQKDQLLLAENFRKTGKYNDEIRVLKKILEKSPQNHEIHFNIGSAFMHKKEFTEASIHFREAIKIRKKFRPAYEALLTIFQDSGNNYESRNILGDIQKVFGKDSLTYAHLCRLDSLDGFLEPAIKGCRQAIRTDPEVPASYFYLAQSLDDQGDHSSSEKTLLMAAKKFPQSEFIQWATGQFYLKQNNHATAKRYFEKAVQVKDNSVRALLGLAICQFEQEMYEEALESFMKACQGDETVLEKIREAAGKLRQKKKDQLSRKYSQQVYNCKKTNTKEINIPTKNP